MRDNLNDSMTRLAALHAIACGCDQNKLDEPPDIVAGRHITIAELEAWASSDEEGEAATAAANVDAALARLAGGAEDEKDAGYAKGEPADPTENMTPEDKKKWDENVDHDGSNIKAADVYGPFRTPKDGEDFVFNNFPNPGEWSEDGSGSMPVPRRSPSGEPVIDPDNYGGRGVWRFADVDESIARLAEGCPDNLDEAECKEWEANTDKYKDVVKDVVKDQAKTASFLDDVFMDASLARVAEIDVEAKFPKGVTMTVDEVAAVVGPEFKEMHENPPPSVLKLREEMQGKTAGLPIEGSFAKRGKDYVYVQAVLGSTNNYPSGWVDIVGTLTDTDETELAQLDGAGKPGWMSVHASSGGMSGADWAREGWRAVPVALIPVPWKEWFKVQLREWHPRLAAESDDAKEGKFEKGEDVPLSEMPDELEENAKNPPPEVQKVKDEMKAKSACGEDEDEGLDPEHAAVVAAYRAQIERVAARKLGSNVDRRWQSFFLPASIAAGMVGGKYAYMPFNHLSREDQAQARRAYRHGQCRHGSKYDFVAEHYHYPVKGDGSLAHAQRFLAVPKSIINDDEAMARMGYEVCPEWTASGRTAASGLYGSNKAIEGACLSCTRQLERKASSIARAAYKKAEDAAPFLATHAKRGKSLAAKILVAEMQKLGPKVASRIASAEAGAASAPPLLPSAGKVAGKAEHGLYGFKAKAAREGLQACTDLRHAAGILASGLNSRKADRHGEITGFLDEHCKTGKCLYAKLIRASYPEPGARTASAPTGVDAWLAFED